MKSLMLAGFRMFENGTYEAVGSTSLLKFVNELVKRVFELEGQAHIRFIRVDDALRIEVERNEVKAGYSLSHNDIQQDPLIVARVINMLIAQHYEKEVFTPCDCGYFNIIGIAECKHGAAQ